MPFPDPDVGAHVMVDLPLGEPTRTLGLGAGGRAHVDLGEHGLLGAEVYGAPTLDGAWVAGGWAQGGLRVDGAREAWGVYAGGGLEHRGALRPLIGVGADVSFHGSSVVAPRLGMALVGLPGEAAFQVQLGLVERRRAAPVPPPVLPPAAPSPAFVVEPAGVEARVWLPHPVCEWLPLAEAEARARSLSGATPAFVTPAFVTAPGYRASPVDLGNPGTVALQPALEQGAVMLVGHPGDVFRVGGLELQPQPDGTYLLTAAPGPVVVEVRGGGRRVELPVAVVAGHATWRRAPAPEPLVVPFALGSAEPDADARAKLAAYVADRGESRLVVQGSYSEEGTVAANEALAVARAEAVRSILLGLGVPADAVVIGAPTLPLAGADPAAQRRAVVRVAEPADPTDPARGGAP